MKNKPVAITVEDNWSVKYRPKNLNELVGQNAVVNSIKGMFKRGKIPHSILITGDPGSGKTTIARIIAMMVNSFDPTKNITSYSDIQEINASEERGIEAVRNLLKSINFLPQEGKFKVFILDEVHALTGPAADAFLKPLEEPPPHVIWILATNEPQKLKETLRRRCMTLRLDQINPQDVVTLLERVAEAENVFQPVKKYIKLIKFVANTTGGKPGNSLQLLNNLANVNAAKPIDVDNSKYLRQALKEAMQGLDVGTDKVAVAILIAIYMKKESVIKYINDTQDYMTLSWYLLELSSFMLDRYTGIHGYKTYSRTMLTSYLEKKNINPTFSELVCTHTGLIGLRNELILSKCDPKHIMYDRIPGIIINLEKKY